MLFKERVPFSFTTTNMMLKHKLNFNNIKLLIYFLGEHEVNFKNHVEKFCSLPNLFAPYLLPFLGNTAGQEG